MSFKYLSRKESILITAVQVLDELGIQGMTTKEIAIREGVSEPAIYRHYKGKEDIILSILGEFSRFDEQLIETIKQQNMEPKRAIRFFCSSLAEYYQGYPEVTAIMFSLDAFRYSLQTYSKMEEIFTKRMGILLTWVECAIETNDFKIEGSSETIRDMIYGFLINGALVWKMNQCESDLKKNVMEMLSTIL